MLQNNVYLPYTSVIQTLLLIITLISQHFAIYCEVPNSCAVRNNSVGWKIHPN